MFGLLSSGIILMSFIGASVKEAYLTLLDLAAALQMISYLYLFASLVRRAWSRDFARVYFGQTLLRVASTTGFAMTTLALAMAFVPSRQVSSIWSFELKMFLTLAAMLGLACGLFYYYRAQKPVLAHA
jgi:hypothetical protein